MTNKQRVVQCSVMVLLVTLLLTSCVDTSKIDSTENERITTTTTPTQSAVSLEMPERVTIEASYLVMTVEPFDEKFLHVTSSFDSEQRTNKTIALTDEQITELNALYEFVTDFSQNPKWDCTTVVTIKDGDKTYRFEEGCANQKELNWYMECLIMLSNEAVVDIIGSFSLHDYDDVIAANAVEEQVAPITTAERADRVAFQMWSICFETVDGDSDYYRTTIMHNSASVFYDEDTACWLVKGDVYDGEKTPVAVMKDSGEILAVWLE